MAEDNSFDGGGKTVTAPEKRIVGESRPGSNPVRLRAALSVTLALTLAACAGGAKVDKKYGVAPSPRVAKGSKIPQGGGRYVVGKPYKIAGKTYRPRLDPNYRATGMASWYGEAFHGRLTANGEVYDMNRLSAAHTTMPLPSYARVTNVKNGRSVIVRVNDRGPFSRSREIDLSQRTAELLDFKKEGLAKVKVEYVGKARLDGRDDEFLMASYRGPGKPGTMFARLDPAPRGAVTAAAPPPRRQRPRPVLASFQPRAAARPVQPRRMAAPPAPPRTASGGGGSLDDDMLGFHGYGRLGAEAVYGTRGTRIVTPEATAPRGPLPPAGIPGTTLGALAPSYAPQSRIDNAFVAIGALFR